MTTITRPQRWDQPFSAAMRDEDVASLLARPPLSELDPERFPASTPLAGIVRNDTRLIRCQPGDLIVRAGDYGGSAFLILEGTTRVALDDLPAEWLGRRSTQRRSFGGMLAQLWPRRRAPESRSSLGFDRSAAAPRAARAGGVGQREADDGAARIFLQDVPGVLDRYRTVVLGAGELFGELAALGRTPRTATVFAESAALLLEIRWQGLRDLRRYGPALKEFVDTRYRQRSLATLLRGTPLLAGIEPAALDEIVEATRFESYGSFDWYGPFKQLQAAGGAPEEALIAEQGHHPNGLLLVCAGFARLSQRRGAGERTLGYLGKGQVFGLDESVAAARSGQAVPLRSSLRALGYVDLLRIPTPIVERLILPRLRNEPGNANEIAAVRPTIAVEAVPERLLDELVDRRLINGTATMMIDLSVCTRCDDCVRACASTHEGNPRFTRAGPVIEDRFHLAAACMHCVDPVCMIGCPTGAIHRSAVGGEVVINDATCIGCGSCAASCPYEAIRMVAIRHEDGEPIVDAGSGLPILKATKCDLCHDQWGGPACQRACPHDALRRIDMSDLAGLGDWITRR